MIEKLGNFLKTPVVFEEISLFSVPLKMKQEFEISTGKISSRKVLVVRLRSEGYSGYGEIPVLLHPIYSGEFYDASVGFVRIVKDITEGRKFSLLDLHNLLQGFRGNNFAKSGIEYAFWHLLFQITGKSIFEMIKPAKSRFRLQLSIGIGSLDDIAARIQWAYSQGIDAIKLKIKPGWSKTPVEFVLKNFSPAFISVDANGSFDPFNPQHIDELREIADMVDEIEQPFKPPLIYKHATFSKSVKAAVSLDESIEKVEDYLEASELFPVVVNIKPPRIGGLLNSLKLVEEINKMGHQAFIGGMLETTWGRVQNMIVASLPSVCDRFPGDFSPADEFYHDDLAEPGFKIKNGHIEIVEPGEIHFKENLLKSSFKVV